MSKACEGVLETQLPIKRSRIFKKRRLGGVVSALALAMILAACGSSAASSSSSKASSTTQSAATPVSGGTANIAIVSDPPTLDWTYSTSTITHEVSWNIFEQLFAFDKDYKIRPMLATGYTMSSNGLSYTIPLRTNVHFQNGQLMTAKDVVASIQRWGEISSPGILAMSHIASITATNSNTVSITMKQPYSPLISDLASPDQAAIIIPASIAQAAGKTPLTDSQIIGTGPYKFVSWQRGQKIVLRKWSGYSALPATDNWGGLAGHKVAYINQLNYDIVPSASVRLSGLQTGEFTLATELSSDSYSQLTQSPNIKPVSVQPADALYIVFNKKIGPFTNPLMREAINLVANKPQIASAAFGNSKFWSLGDSMFFPQQKSLYVTSGESVYKSYDPKKALSLMKQAGYDPNRPIRILVTKTYPYMYNAGVALSQELNSIGIKTDVIVYDWPTDLATRKNPNAWDIFITSFAAEFDPTQLLWISPSYNGWYDSPQMQKDLSDWTSATTASQRTAALEAIQTTEWQQLPAVKVANQILLEGISTKLQNFHSYLDVVMWNTWLSK